MRLMKTSVHQSGRTRSRLEVRMVQKFKLQKRETREKLEVRMVERPGHLEKKTRVS